jgi:hypothetical protein
MWRSRTAPRTQPNELSGRSAWTAMCSSAVSSAIRDTGSPMIVTRRPRCRTRAPPASARAASRAVSGVRMCTYGNGPERRRCRDVLAYASSAQARLVNGTRRIRRSGELTGLIIM